MRQIIPFLIIFSLSINAEKESPMSEEIRKMKFERIEWRLPEVGVDIKRVELPSGSVLFLKENHNVPLIGINVYINGGSSYLKCGEKSISLLLSNLLKSGGTDNFTPSEFIEKMEVNGIRLDIEENNYYYSVSMLTNINVLDTALVLLEEALFNPAFNEEIMKFEMKRLTEEWKAKLHNPNAILNEISNLILYNNHPAGALPDFTLFKAIGKEKLIELKRRFMQPSNMIIGIVGDFDTEVIRQKIERIFSDRYNNNIMLGEIPDLPEELSRKVYFYNMKIPQGFFRIQHRGIKSPFPEMQDVMIMNQILGGGGFTSRIVLKVRNEMGLAYRTRSRYIMDSPISGYFYIYCSTRSDALHLASKYILDEIDKIRNEKVSIEELNITKESVINSSITRYGNDWTYIPMLLSLELTGMPLDYYQNLNDNIEKVTDDGILLSARNYLHPERLSMVIIGDKEKIDTFALKEQFGEIEFIDYKIPEI